MHPLWWSIELRGIQMQHFQSTDPRLHQQVSMHMWWIHGLHTPFIANKPARRQSVSDSRFQRSTVVSFTQMFPRRVVSRCVCCCDAQLVCWSTKVLLYSPHTDKSAAAGIISHRANFLIFSLKYENFHCLFAGLNMADLTDHSRNFVSGKVIHTFAVTLIHPL